jgi:hypothetical protein
MFDVEAVVPKRAAPKFAKVLDAVREYLNAGDRADGYLSQEMAIKLDTFFMATYKRSQNEKQKEQIACGGESTW